MDASFRRIADFIAQLRRRNVFRVGLAYAVAGWFVMQFSSTVFPALALPGWTVTLAILLSLVGFPVALILAWAYELTPDGIRRASELEEREDVDGRTSEAAGTPEGIDPPVASPRDAPPRVSLGLPAHAIPLVGRERELAEAAALIGGSVRLLTLTGPGGIGKTRLAVALAERLAGTKTAGARFMPLSDVDPHRPLAGVLLAQLGAHLSAGDDPGTRLLDFLESKQMLLVLDNFEHLTEQAGIVTEILNHAPGIVAIVTSRERLGLTGEVVFAVDGLPLPTGRDHADREADSVRLFLAGAWRAAPHFRPRVDDLVAIDRICRLVDGLPLGIELASAWVGTISPREIADEIERSRDFLTSSFRDLPARHRSLRAVFESSWRLLSEEERRTYQRLSIFRGGFTRDAASRIAGASLPVLASLVGKSLVRRGDHRLALPGVLRQYAEETLAGDDREQEWLSRAHAEYFAVAAEDAARRLEGTVDAQVLREIGADIPNLRRAWRWSVERGVAPLLDRMLGGLFDFYGARGWAREADELLGRAIEAIEGAPERSRAHARVLARFRSRQGTFAAQLGDLSRAERLLQLALNQFTAADDGSERANALRRLGLLASTHGDYSRARELLTDSQQLYAEIADARGTGRSLSDIGIVAYSIGNYDEAQELWETAIATLRQIGDLSGVSACLKNLGGIAFEKGEHARARAFLHESLEIDRDNDNQVGVVNALHNLGCVASRAGDHDEAERYLEEAIAVSREMGFRPMLAFGLAELANTERIRGRTARSARLYREAAELAVRIDHAPLVLEILVGVAELSVEETGEPAGLASLATALHHPAAMESTRERARGLLASLDGRGDRSTLAAALDRAPETYDLERCVREAFEHPAVVAATAAG